MPRHKGQRSPFWSLFRVAVWLCAAMMAGLAMAFLLNSGPFLTSDELPDAQPAPAGIQMPANEAGAADQAQATYEDTMRDADLASDLAQRQQAQAMKAVEAARALSRNPDSREAKQALETAMREVQAMSQQADRAN